MAHPLTERDAQASWRPAQVRAALLVFAVGALVLLGVSLRWGYYGAFVQLNAATAPLSPLFRYLTQAGDSLIGGALLVLALLLLPSDRGRAERVSLALVGIVALVLLGLLVQLLKRQVFGAWHRPWGLYEGVLSISYTDVEGGRHFAFPSGHAKTAVCCALVLCYLLRPMGQLAAAGLGLLIAYSRVAVGMHFPLDVVAGGALAVAVALPLVDWLAPRWTRALDARSERLQRRWHLSLLVLAAVGLVVGVGLRFF